MKKLVMLAAMLTMVLTFTVPAVAQQDFGTDVCSTVILGSGGDGGEAGDGGGDGGDGVVGDNAQDVTDSCNETFNEGDAIPTLVFEQQVGESGDVDMASDNSVDGDNSIQCATSHSGVRND